MTQEFSKESEVVIMPEAKSLTHMALTAMFAAMLITAAVGLIHVGHLMWSAFSAQEATNERMQQFAKYAAFETAEVRGQDVISLIHDTQGDPFVIVIGMKKPENDTEAKTALINYENWFKDPTGAHDGAEIQVLATNAVMASYNLKEFRCEGDTHAWFNDRELGSLLNTSTLIVDWQNQVSDPDINTKKAILNFSSDNLKPKYEELQTFFLKAGHDQSYAYYKTPGNESKPGGAKDCYLEYASFLYYDNETSEVAGVLLIEKPCGADILEDNGV